ncbi:MAG: 2-amino-4-hydroxy-6-hydroxymethyldihydropteridine diphosphokinase [Calditrichaeota bacterium]|nr:MAG: 2-amino-4-hydroxy-6-hydroxymethyldihydropteridine diphosphokinase [Calditrichota bacterium]
MNNTFITLGSNIEPRSQYLQQALQKLVDYGVIKKIAPLYESLPYGNTKQPAFLNSAVQFLTPLQPRKLLQALKKIEQEIGRQKSERWGPREIDLDIIFYEQVRMETPELVIPHPDYQNRRFVLQPLCDIDPEFHPPGSQLTISQLLIKCPDNNPLTLMENEWYAHDITI